MAHHLDEKGEIRTIQKGTLSHQGSSNGIFNTGKCHTITSKVQSMKEWINDKILSTPVYASGTLRRRITNGYAVYSRCWCYYLHNLIGMTNQLDLFVTCDIRLFRDELCDQTIQLKVTFDLSLLFLKLKCTQRKWSCDTCNLIPANLWPNGRWRWGGRVTPLGTHN